jgi:hypothetical protein
MPSLTQLFDLSAKLKQSRRPRFNAGGAPCDTPPGRQGPCKEDGSSDGSGSGDTGKGGYKIAPDGKTFTDRHGKVWPAIPQTPEDYGAHGREVTARANAQVMRDPQAAIDEYMDRFGRKASGTVDVNADNVREIFPDYAKDKSLSGPVHEASSYIAKLVYAQALAAPVPPGVQDMVVHSAGGTGAGKTTALALVAGTDDPPSVMYDSNMNGFGSAERRLLQGVNAGKQNRIVFVDRDIDKSLHTMLSRAMHKDKDGNSMGRTVPLDAHMETHINSPTTVVQLYDKYKDHPQVSFQVISNNGTRDDVAPMSLKAGIAHLRTKQIDEKQYKETRSKLVGIVNDEYKKGNIDERVYKGVLGYAPPKR